MKVVFFGTPDFAVPTLEKMVELHDVLAVVTQPDRPKNRGHRLEPSPVKKAALVHGIPVLTPERVKDAVDLIPMADAYVVVAYGQIFPKALLEKPRYGCFNIHASLLPKYRGAAPMQRAIEAGEVFSGVGIMQMDAGLDTGDVLAEEVIRIDSLNIEQLHDALSVLGPDLLASVLRDREEGRCNPRKQDDAKASYAKMITKADYEYSQDWTLDVIKRKIRAFQYIRTKFGDKRIKIFAVDADSVRGAEECSASTESQEAAVVLCGGALWLRAVDGCIQVTELQPENGKKMLASAFVNGIR